MKSAVLVQWKITTLSNVNSLFSGELHLTPLHGILQLRPSFTYLDKADAKHREREAANEGKCSVNCVFFWEVRCKFYI